MLKNAQSFLRKKNIKLVTWSKIIAQQPKPIENPSVIDKKSVTIEHLKTSHKLSETIIQAKMVSQVGADKNSPSPLHSKTTKRENFLDKEKAKKLKRSYDFKGYASSYNVDILKFFDPESQLKDTESTIRNKLKDLLN